MRFLPLLGTALLSPRDFRPETDDRPPGRTRFDRLFLIARSSVPLCIDALKAAIAEAKKGRDTQQYREAVECLRVASPNDPDATFDQQWLDATDKTNRVELNRLSVELKAYKNNLVRESIRVGLPLRSSYGQPDIGGRWATRT